jgi:hypothetical protein
MSEEANKFYFKQKGDRDIKYRISSSELSLSIESSHDDYYNETSYTVENLEKPISSNKITNMKDLILTLRDLINLLEGKELYHTDFHNNSSIKYEKILSFCKEALVYLICNYQLDYIYTQTFNEEDEEQDEEHEDKEDEEQDEEDDEDEEDQQDKTSYNLSSFSQLPPLFPTQPLFTFNTNSGLALPIGSINGVPSKFDTSPRKLEAND